MVFDRWLGDSLWKKLGGLFGLFGLMWYIIFYLGFSNDCFIGNENSVCRVGINVFFDNITKLLTQDLFSYEWPGVILILIVLPAVCIAVGFFIGAVIGKVIEGIRGKIKN
jgi:hypothetical protein